MNYNPYNHTFLRLFDDALHLCVVVTCATLKSMLYVDHTKNKATSQMQKNLKRLKEELLN